MAVASVRYCTVTFTRIDIRIHRHVELVILYLNNTPACTMHIHRRTKIKIIVEVSTEKLSSSLFYIQIPEKQL